MLPNSNTIQAHDNELITSKKLNKVEHISFVTLYESNHSITIDISGITFTDCYRLFDFIFLTIVRYLRLLSVWKINGILMQVYLKSSFFTASSRLK